jgi:DNA polymerase-3 subunit alpha
MNIFREWIKNNKDEILNKLNNIIFMQDWNKYAKKNNISSWEMEALCFYYHEHELANVDKKTYGLVDFTSLPEQPEVDRMIKRKDIMIPIYKLHRICGTCIAKNKTKSTVTLLTTTGVVSVKFNKEYFAKFDAQISQKNNDGTKTIVERSWFNRGNMMIVNGMRRGDEFVAKKYSTTEGHQLYHIDEVNEDGSLVLRSERAKGEISEDD